VYYLRMPSWKIYPVLDSVLREITEWPVVEGIQGSSISNPPARQGNQPPHLLDQVAQGPIQPGLEMFSVKEG